MNRPFLRLDGNRVVGFDPAAPNAERTVYPTIPQIKEMVPPGAERTVASRLPESTVEAMRKIHEQIWNDAHRTPEYFEEVLESGDITVEQIFEMLAAFKETRDNLTRAGQLTINELRALVEMRTTAVPTEEIRQVINNLSKRLT